MYKVVDILFRLHCQFFFLRSIFIFDFSVIFKFTRRSKNKNKTKTDDEFLFFGHWNHFCIPLSFSRSPLFHTFLCLGPIDSSSFIHVISSICYGDYCIMKSMNWFISHKFIQKNHCRLPHLRI